MAAWLSSVVKETKKQYFELFGHQLEPEISIINKENWETELQKRNVKKRKSEAVYLIHEILLREDATYFQVLHEVGHEACYKQENIKEKLLQVIKLQDNQKLKEIELEYPEKFLEQKADEYALILSNKVKEKIPSLIYKTLSEENPIFIVMNGTFYTKGWGQDIDIWFIKENENPSNIQYPKEWDVDVMNEKRFEEGIQNVDGIYLDFVKNGKIIYDPNNYSKIIQEKAKTVPSKNEVIYHFNEANWLISSARKRLLQLNNLQQQILHENGKNIFEIILTEQELPMPQYFFNALGYAISYAYLGKEYAKGIRPIISEKHPSILDEIQKQKNTRKGINFYKKIEDIQAYVKECAREAKSYLKNLN